MIGGGGRKNGWEFAAKIEHSEDGNIIKVMPTFSEKGKSIPEKYWHTSQWECEVCGVNRYRTETFVVYHEGEDKWMQVGRSCLSQVVSIKVSIDVVVEWYEGMFELCNDEKEGRYSDGYYGDWLAHRSAKMQVKDILGLAVRIAAVEGYRSKKNAMENGGVATVERMMDYLFGKSNSPDISYLTEDQKEYANRMEAGKIIAWAREEAVGNYTDYWNNIGSMVATENRMIKQDNFALVVSLLGGYMTHLTRNESRNNTNFVGEVGKKWKGEVKIVNSITFSGSYGVTVKNVMIDRGGDVIVWSTAVDLQLVYGNDTWFTIEGSVKEHSVYRDQKQTMITRCKHYA